MTRLWPKGEAIETWGGQETPAGFIWQGASQGGHLAGSHRILGICNRWRIHTNWWNPTSGGSAVWREYLKVTTDQGLLCLIYRDLIKGNWFLARVYD